MRYQKHESFWADLQIYMQIIFKALLFGVAFQILLLIYFTNDLFQSLDQIYTQDNVKLPFSVAVKYYTGVGGLVNNGIPVDMGLLPYSKGWEELPKEYYRLVADYATNNAYKYYAEQFNNKLFVSLSAYLASIFYLVLFLRNKSEDEKYIRGAKILPIEKLNKLLKKSSKDNSINLRIGETVIPFEMEPKHMLILGTAGSGKGVLLNQFMKQIKSRKEKKCVYYDVKGEFIEKQYNPKNDLIFSPFDARSLHWNLFNELKIRPDFDVISRSLFANNDEKNAYWYNCAADVFRTGLIYLKLRGRTSNRDLWDFFSQTSTEIVDAFMALPLEEQGAIKHIDKSDSPASASIISILQERIQFFRYLVDIDGDFSFRDFIRENQFNNRSLFILNIEQYNIIFKPLMTLTIEMMCREALSLPDDPYRRIFFFLDELGTLGKMDSVLQLLTVGRSKGACLFCANQDLGRIEEQYGKSNLKTFFNNFNTKVTLRILEPETSEFLSKAIGEHQVLKTSENLNMSADKKTLSEHEQNERLILPTEFQDLPDLTAIITIAGFGISKIEIPAIFFPKQHPNFMMREFEEMRAIVVNKVNTVEDDKQIIADEIDYTPKENPGIKKEKLFDKLRNV